MENTDARVLLQHIYNTYGYQINDETQTPTAYDVDKVVEQFKTDSLVKLYGSGNSDNYLIPVKRAIEIVKAGGIGER